MFKVFALLACVALLAPLVSPRRSFDEGVEGGGMMFARHSMFADTRSTAKSYVRRNGISSPLTGAEIADNYKIEKARFDYLP